MSDLVPDGQRGAFFSTRNLLAGAVTILGTGIGAWLIKLPASVDDGSLTIPQSLIAGLIGFGFAGFPTIHIARKSVAGANIETGRVTLEITSDVELPLSIPGLVSCITPDDCESEQICGTDRTCQ